MGGRGGLNILPQKKWNVYNWDNRIKVSQNEKIVKEEMEQRKHKRRHNKIDNKIYQIKSKTHDHGNNTHHFDVEYEISDKEKNQIFKEKMERNSILKRVNHDLTIQNNNKIISMNESINYEKIKSIDEITLQNHQQCTTIKEALNTHLKPWYIQKKNEEINTNKLLSSKREREIDNDNHNHNDNDFLMIKKLRTERNIREQREHTRIMNLILNKNLS